MDKFIQLLQKRMAQRGFTVDTHHLAQFGIYWQELKDWSTRVNLRSIKDDQDIIDKHFVDSLLLLRYGSPEYWTKVADIGAGAGFPGIPLKICQPGMSLSLLESTGKKARFLEHIVSRLELENASVINERAEIAAQVPEHREQYNLVIARSVAALPVLAEYCLPFVSVGGKFVAYKGYKAEAEVEESAAALERLGGRFEKVEWDTGSGLDRRSLVFIEKITRTPDKYPRRPGIPRKRPL